MFRRKFLTAAIVAAVACLGIPASGQAAPAFSVTISGDGTNTFLVNDEQTSVRTPTVTMAT